MAPARSIGTYRGISRRNSGMSDISIPDTGSRPTSPLQRPYDFHGFSNASGDSRPGSPFNKNRTIRHSRKSKSCNLTHTSLLAPPSSCKDSSLSNSMDMDPPSTVTWNSATAVVENQQVQTSYEKPLLSESGQILSYGKMLTKTVTMTITTTIASTEITRPQEEGYRASFDDYVQQQNKKASNPDFSQTALATDSGNLQRPQSSSPVRIQDLLH